MAMTKSGPLDAIVGARIRLLRVRRGMSQTALAARIGVTFQQLQRYEQGVGRVGAGRLARIAFALDVSVGEFFESSRSGPAASKSPVCLLGEPGVRQIVEAYARMPDPRTRSCIARLVETVADREAGSKAAITHLNAVKPGERRKFP